MLNFILLLILGLILVVFSLKQKIVGKKFFLFIFGITIVVCVIINVFVNTYDKVSDVRIYPILLFLFIGVGIYIIRRF